MVSSAIRTHLSVRQRSLPSSHSSLGRGGEVISSSQGQIPRQGGREGRRAEGREGGKEGGRKGGKEGRALHPPRVDADHRAVVLRGDRP